MRSIFSMSLVALFAFSSHGYANDIVDRCRPILNELAANHSEAALLFVSTRDGWKSLNADTPSFFFGSGGNRIAVYGNEERLQFIYVAARSDTPLDAERTRFLAVKTRSMDVRGEPIVHLRRQLQRYSYEPAVEVYQSYHRGESDWPREMKNFHYWGSLGRSDSSFEQRNSYLLPEEGRIGDQTNTIKRVLSIPYKASDVKRSCVPFVLGPNLAAYQDQDGSEEFPTSRGAPAMFVIEVVEVGSSNKFTVSYQP